MNLKCCNHSIGKTLHPATKEQRDLLFQKMKEAGYKWENNQLAKISNQLEEINNDGSVDLGLPSGTLWAKCNLGAEKETDFGLFYQWGDIEGHGGDARHDFSWSTNKWGTYENLTKYNKGDGETSFHNEDDPVYVATGGKMKCPTNEQLLELINHTNHEWMEIDGVKGMRFTNKSDDTKYIFIPAAGDCYTSYHGNVGSWGCVWSSSRNSGNPNFAWRMYFYSGDVYMSNDLRCYGFSVRGVVA